VRHEGIPLAIDAEAVYIGTERWETRLPRLRGRRGCLRGECVL